MPIAATRGLLHAALAGALDRVEYRVDPVFGFEVPVFVPGVDPALLDPRATWSDALAYDAKAQELAAMFRENFETRFASDVDPAVAVAGPLVTSSG
jgi:phosphoenolpyruvate carboxykinase (ATP)